MARPDRGLNRGEINRAATRCGQPGGIASCLAILPLLLAISCALRPDAASEAELGIARAIRARDWRRAEALVDAYAVNGALPSRLFRVRSEMNGMQASDSFHRGDLGAATVFARRALLDEPTNRVAKDVLAAVEARRRARREAQRVTVVEPSQDERPARREPREASHPPLPDAPPAPSRPQEPQSTAAPAPPQSIPPDTPAAAPATTTSAAGDAAASSPPASPAEGTGDPERIARKVEEVFRGSFEVLPESFVTPGTKKGWPRVRMTNASAYVLTVMHSGKAYTGEVVLRPQQSETIDLPPGLYRIAVEANAPAPVVFAGERTYEEDSEHSIVFRIEPVPWQVG
jgi:hypothetical protein